MIDSGIIEEAAEQLRAAVEDVEVEHILSELFYELLDYNGGCTRSFEEAGVMTYNRGLVIRAPESGAEFQLTIVKSA